MAASCASIWGATRKKTHPPTIGLTRADSHYDRYLFRGSIIANRGICIGLRRGVAISLRISRYFFANWRNRALANGAKVRPADQLSLR